MKKPQPIRFILKNTFRALEIDGHLKTYSIFGAWREIVGESISLHTQPRSIRNRILFIDVSHSTWMQQLQFLKTNLLEKINAFLGEQTLQDIRFKLGKISPSNSPVSKTNVLQKENLDEPTLMRIEGLLQKIDDEEVKSGLRNILIKGAKLEQFRKKAEKF